MIVGYRKDQGFLLRNKNAQSVRNHSIMTCQVVRIVVSDLYRRVFRAGNDRGDRFRLTPVPL